MKESIISKYLKQWKALLRLDDWNITVLVYKPKKYIKYIRKNYINLANESDAYILSLDAITDCGSIADKEAQPFIYERKAEIVILDKDITEEQLEKRLVHELLHIMLSYIVVYKTDLEVAKVEQVIRTLENLLIQKEK